MLPRVPVGCEMDGLRFVRTRVAIVERRYRQGSRIGSLGGKRGYEDEETVRVVVLGVSFAGERYMHGHKNCGLDSKMYITFVSRRFFSL